MPSTWHVLKLSFDSPTGTFLDVVHTKCSPSPHCLRSSRHTTNLFFHRTRSSESSGLSLFQAFMHSVKLTQSVLVERFVTSQIPKDFGNLRSPGLERCIDCLWAVTEIGVCKGAPASADELSRNTIQAIGMCESNTITSRNLQPASESLNSSFFLPLKVLEKAVCSLRDQAQELTAYSNIGT